MTTTIEFFLGAAVLATLAGCFVGWAVACRRMATGTDLMPMESRRPVPWGLVDLASAFVVVLVLQFVTMGLLSQVFRVPVGEGLTQLDSPQKAVLMAGMAVASFIAWAIVLVLVRWRSQATWAELGWVKGRFWHDVRLGLIAFGMLSVPVFLVQWLLTLLFKPFGLAQHPLIESLRDGYDPTFFFAGAIAAVIIAPLVEEYFFRLLLQGWLENFSLYAQLRRERSPSDNGDSQRLVMGARDWPAVAEVPKWVVDVPASEVAISTSSHDATLTEDFRSNPSPAPRSVPFEVVEGRSPPCEVVDGCSTQVSPRPARWPIFASALLFASVHFGQGVAPVALFVLALGLGYLYQRTHRILPCIVVHASVNGLSMVQLWVLIHSPNGGGPG